MKIRKVGRWIVAAVALMLVVFLFTGNESVLKVWASRKQGKGQLREITRLHREIDSLNEVIARLKTDTLYIEKMAREKLGMARENEKVFKFVQEK
jgi:cell division protein FtsB